MKPLVSIITPMFNAEDFISETMDSVMSQTYDKWEMIVVDNCSTDGSKEIVSDYMNRDSRIRLLELDFNSGGPARPRNTGIEYASGPFLAFLDADDIWQADKIEKQVTYLTGHNDVSLVYSAFHIMSDGVVCDEVWPKKKWIGIGDTFGSLFLSNNFIGCSTVMIKKGRDLPLYFDEAPEMVAIEDFDLWLRIAEKNRIACIPEPLVIYRMHARGTAGSSRQRNMRQFTLIKKWKTRVGIGQYIMKCICVYLYIVYSELKNQFLINPNKQNPNNK